ncbi:F-box incomplete domain containing protein [Pandoravirus salinus]|uniref:F-box incomplete domain containing protein n=1 Tax=Pandoravirus salinus TaxID=1349410 RepID=S4W0S8_9VIRU|nr:F-box incomplete domain [Pandoravirus salinus]AGO83972.1 F-box incomplete domain containing protein [Pandoravirus salinus]
MAHRRRTDDDRVCDSGTVTPLPTKRARVSADPQTGCIAYQAGGALGTAPTQQSMIVAVLPDEILCAIMGHLYPTSALVRAGSVCSRFHQAAAFIRAQRRASRCRAGPHADPIGCAHQLLNAISLDDPDAAIDALDTGNVSFDDLLDPAYLWSAAAHNVVATVVGPPSLTSDGRTGRPILERVDQDPARTGYYAPIEVAILCGSLACVRALVAMGARVSACRVGPLVRFVAGTLAWNDIYVRHVPSVIVKAGDILRIEAHPRVPATARHGEPDNAHVDPIKLLSPIMSSLPATYLGGTPGRGILLGVMAKAMGRIACADVGERPHSDSRSAHVDSTNACGAFSPCAVTGLDSAVVADFARAIDRIVSDACALATLLMDHGCRPWCAVRAPFGKQPTERRDGSPMCGDLEEKRREIDRNTERSAAVELLDGLRAHHEKSASALLGAEAAQFLIESLVALYDRLHPPP